MRPLYEIDTDLRIAMEQAELQAEQQEGEISDFLAHQLDALEGERELKIGNICRFIKSLKAEAEMVKAEEKNLAERKRVCENKANYLKNYLSSFMNEGEKFSDSNSKVSWRKSTSVEIAENFSFDQAPENWLRITTAWDKTVIKDAIKEGYGNSCVKIVEKQNIQIK